jgi:hypothetical protein
MPLLISSHKSIFKQKLTILPILSIGVYFEITSFGFRTDAQGLNSRVSLGGGHHSLNMVNITSSKQQGSFLVPAMRFGGVVVFFTTFFVCFLNWILLCNLQIVVS